MANVTATLRSNLGEIARTMEAKAQVIVDKTAADIEAGAKIRSRVDTGAMKASWTVVPVGPAHSEVRNGVEYVIYNEYGTRHMSAQPMAVPAAEQARPGFEAAAKRIVE
jgi:HK97 gp10 family phage protein